jgi:GNAT superfamily N-acetyltransferase
VCLLADDARGEVKDVYVVPEAWGTGVAGGLMSAALDALRDMGATEAFLWVVEENPRARRFYERDGWTHDGTSKPSPLGPPELRYTKALGSTPD